MLKNQSTILFLFVLQLLNTRVDAQVSELRFKHYTTNDGLSQGNIYRMTQDSRGFMWFATFDGLNRFDGYDFKVFRTSNSDTNAIKGGHIYSIVEDKDGMMWVGTDVALNRYDFKTGHFDHFYFSDSANQKRKVYYAPFFIDDKNELWFIYNTNLASINISTGKRTTYPFADGAMEGFATAGYLARQLYKHLSKIYTTGNSGLHIIDIDQRKINFYFSSNPKNQYGADTRIDEALEDKNHLLWLSTMKGLMSFNPLTKERELYDEYNGKKISSSLAMDWDKDGNLWCAGAGMGLSLFNTTTKLFIRNYHKNPIDPESIGRNFVNSLFIDKDNNIWMGIDPDGIDKVNPSYQQLNYVKINLLQDEGYSSSVGSLYEIDTDHLVICSNHADIIRYNKMTGLGEKVDLPEKLKTSIDVTALLDSRKQLWVASDSGLYCSDEKLKIFKLVEKKNFNNATLFEFGQKIFIGASEGLFTLPLNVPTKGMDTLHLFDGKLISFIGQSPAGLLCITTFDKELYLIDMRGRKPVIIKKINSDFLIKSVFFQDENRVWFATNEGLVRYNLSHDSLKTYTEKDGLANNFVYCVLKGNDGNLWMSTNGGISKFDLQTERFTNFSLTEGAQGREFNTHSFFQSPSGTIYFGGVKGFSYFNPSTIKEFDFEPRVEILNVTANGNSVPLESVSQQNKPLRFGSHENNISIEFAAIDFNRNDHINYLYKLHDKDEWTSIGKQRTLSFANLSPGNYYLQVKAQYSYNTVSPHILNFSFRVLPSFYQTPWFIVLISVLVILIGYNIYRYRIRHFLKLQAIRNNIARDLHDEVGATLSGIHIYSSVAEKAMGEDTEKAKGILRQINHNARKVMEDMNDIVWAMNTTRQEEITLSSRIKNYGYELLSQKNIECLYEVDLPAEQKLLKPEARKNILMIVKESLNNIAKHSDATQASISITADKNNFLIAITDNGKGMDADTIRKGNGLSNIEHRTAMLGGTSVIDSSPGHGTTVRCSIPLTNISDS